MALRIEQKIRVALTGHSYADPVFQHEGEEVTRWVTGGTLPDLQVTFHVQGDQVRVRCSICHAPLGSFPSHYGGNTAQQLAAMRQSGHRH